MSKLNQAFVAALSGIIRNALIGRKSWVESGMELANFNIDADTIRAEAQKVAGSITVKDKNGNEKPGKVNTTSLENLIVGATRADAPEILAAAKTVADSDNRGVTTPHVVAAMAEALANNPNLTVDGAADVARAKYKGRSDMAKATAELASASKSFSNAVAAFTAEARKHLSKDKANKMSSGINEGFDAMKVAVEAAIEALKAAKAL